MDNSPHEEQGEDNHVRHQNCLRKLRIAKGLARGFALERKEVAKELGFHLETYKDWELGYTLPHPDARVRLCDYFTKEEPEIWPELALPNKKRRRQIVQLTQHSSSAPFSPDEIASDVCGRTEDTPTSLQSELPIFSSLPSSPYETSTEKQPNTTRRMLTRIFIGFAGLTGLSTVGFFAVGKLWGQHTPPVQPAPTIGSPIYTYQLPKNGSYETLVNALAWSPDSSHLACAAGNHTACIYKIGEANAVIYSGHGNHDVNDVAWLPNGQEVISGGADRTVQLWGAFTASTRMAFQATASVWAVAAARDGKRIAWAGGDGIVEVWSIKPQARLLTYNRQAGSGGIWGLAFSHNGKWLASGDSQGDIQVFDANHGIVLKDYTGHTNTIFGLAWSPDDRFIASVSGDGAGENGSVRIWEPSSGKTLCTREYNMVAMQSVCWSQDGTRIASAGADGTVQLWDMGKDSSPLYVYQYHSGKVLTVDWSADGNKIASGDENGDIQVWHAK